MSNYDIYEKRNELADSIQRFLDEEDSLKGLKSKVSDALIEAQANLEYWIQSDMANNLAAFVHQMAKEAIEAMLNGDEDTMRRHLHCQRGYYTGRDREHPVIHGKLFETGAIELRKGIVNAHPELLKNERILDLEDQVASLVKQVNDAEQRTESMWQRVRDCQ
jgi:hypothetical protein